MKLRKRLLLLPLLGILMLLLCGCENDDAVSIYIDELPEMQTGRFSSVTAKDIGMMQQMQTIS